MRVKQHRLSCRNHLLQDKGDKPMGPAIRSFGTEVGLPETQLQEILAQPSSWL